MLAHIADVERDLDRFLDFHAREDRDEAERTNARVSYLMAAA